MAVARFLEIRERKFNFGKTNSLLCNLEMVS